MIGYTKAGNVDKPALVTLEILGQTNELRRGVVDRNYAYFRTNKAKVIDIELIDPHTLSLTGVKLNEVKVRRGTMLFVTATIVETEWDPKELNQAGGKGIFYLHDRIAAINYDQHNYDWLKIKNIAAYYHNGAPNYAGLFYGSLTFWTEWHDNGKVAAIGWFKNKQPLTPWMNWDVDGQRN